MLDSDIEFETEFPILMRLTDGDVPDLVLVHRPKKKLALVAMAPRILRLDRFSKVIDNFEEQGWRCQIISSV